MSSHSAPVHAEALSQTTTREGTPLLTSSSADSCRSTSAAQECAQFLSSSHQTSAQRGVADQLPPPTHAVLGQELAEGSALRTALFLEFPELQPALSSSNAIRTAPGGTLHLAVVKAICQSLTCFQVVSVSCTLVCPLFLQTPLVMNRLFYCLCSCPPLLVSVTELLLSRRPIGLAYTLIQTWLFPSDF